MTILVDSDILIEVSRGRNDDIVSNWLSVSESDKSVLYSPVTMAELWAGARPSEFDALQRLFQQLRPVPVDAETGRKAGDILRQYRRSHGLEMADALIGAAAILQRAKLWTRNKKHYPMKDISFFE